LSQQPFLSDGNLNPGIHTYKVNDFQSQFVTGFPNSVSRQSIFSNFDIWISQLNKILPPRFIWLDGSYLTKKIDPKDMDLIVFYYPEDIVSQQMSDDLQNIINNISRTLDCDAYMCYSFDHWSPQQIATVPQEMAIMQTYWMGQFGFDRNKRPKGIIQLDQPEILMLGGVI
jgi:hypothetical protein